MSGAVTISRFSIPAGKEREYEEMLRSFGDAVANDMGFESTSVWQDIKNPAEFMRLTSFKDFDSLFKSYDHMVESGFLEGAVLKWGVAPDVRRQIPIWSHHFDFARAHESEILSLSVRAMEPGQGDAWADKMRYNFTEMQVLPGMHGCWIGRSDEIDDEISGIATWATEEACCSSIPDHLHYPIHVYRRYR